MCYRFSNVQEQKEFRASMKRMGKKFAEKNSDKKFSFFHTNGFSHEELPVITMQQPDDISWMHWGLIPAQTKSKADKDKYWKLGYTLNARSEEVFTTWSFKNPIKDKRCLIPATGFFEWREHDGVKYPYLVQVKTTDFPDDTQSFFFAGVYDRWTDTATGEVIEGFAILTTEANDMMQKIHINPKREDLGGRMPVIVANADFDKWLNSDATFEELEEVMQSFDEDCMQAYTVTKDITSRKLDPNRPEVLAHTPYDTLGDETSFHLPLL